VRRIAILVLPECSTLGLAAVTEPLFVANWLAREAAFATRVVSTDGRPVRASDGRRLAVDDELAAVADAATLFVLASFEARAALGPPLLAALRRLARRGVELVGIENGTLALAAAGLLDGHAVAVHWDNLQGFAEGYPATRPLAQLYARSGQRVSCAGAAAVLDLMVAWIGWHAGAALAAEVGEHLLFGPPRDGATPQRAGPAAGAGNAIVAAARAEMLRHLEEPLACGELARRVGLSLRQVERHFRAEAGCSLLQDYRRIRIGRAHQLLQQTTRSVTEVAFACGFSSHEYFCRLYRTVFGCAPSRDRRQSTAAPVLRRPPPPPPPPAPRAARARR
jgi:AraC family carnitine catabolism transcriptional activator